MKWIFFKNRYDYVIEEGWVYVGMEFFILFYDLVKVIK